MHASSAPSHHVHSSPAAVAPTGRAASALCAPLYSSCCNPRHRRVERDVQQRPAAAQHRSSSLYAPAAHRSRAHEIRRHQVHAMLWDGRQEGLAAAREWPLRLPRRMVPKMRVDRAPSTFVSFFLFSLAFRTKRDGAHADSDCLARSNSDLFVCTHRCGRSAQFSQRPRGAMCAASSAAPASI